MHRHEPRTRIGLDDAGYGLSLTRRWITLSMLDSGPEVRVPAMARQGLAVHRVHHRDATPDTPITYAVTHVASGLAVAKDIPSRTAARGVLGTLLRCYAHWERPQKDIPTKLAPLARRLQALALTKREGRA